MTPVPVPVPISGSAPGGEARRLGRRGGRGVGAADDQEPGVQGQVETQDDPQPGLQGALGAPQGAQPGVQARRHAGTAVQRLHAHRVRALAGAWGRSCSSFVRPFVRFRVEDAAVVAVVVLLTRPSLVYLFGALLLFRFVEKEVLTRPKEILRDGTTFGVTSPVKSGQQVFRCFCSVLFSSRASFLNIPLLLPKHRSYAETFEPFFFRLFFFRRVCGRDNPLLLFPFFISSFKNNIFMSHIFAYDIIGRVSFVSRPLVRFFFLVSFFRYIGNRGHHLRRDPGDRLARGGTEVRGGDLGRQEGQGKRGARRVQEEAKGGGRGGWVWGFSFFCLFLCRCSCPWCCVGVGFFCLFSMCGLVVLLLSVVVVVHAAMRWVTSPYGRHKLVISFVRGRAQADSAINVLRHTKHSQHPGLDSHRLRTAGECRRERPSRSPLRSASVLHSLLIELSRSLSIDESKGPLRTKHVACKSELHHCRSPTLTAGKTVSNFSFSLLSDVDELTFLLLVKNIFCC